MAELTSSSVLSKQDIKNKKIDNRLTELETDVNARLENLEFTKRINISEWIQHQSSMWYYCEMSEDDLSIVKEFGNAYDASDSTLGYIFQCYLRLNKIQLTCTKIERDYSDYVLYFDFENTIVRIKPEVKWFMTTLSDSDRGPCQLILHYSLL